MIITTVDENYTDYIGRGGIFGNEFRIGIHGNRTKCIELYEISARKNSELLKAIKNLPENAILYCPGKCKPKPCHGDIIIKIWREQHE